jgi:hypothetical protein
MANPEKDLRDRYPDLLAGTPDRHRVRLVGELDAIARAGQPPHYVAASIEAALRERMAARRRGDAARGPARTGSDVGSGWRVWRARQGRPFLFAGAAVFTVLIGLLAVGLAALLRGWQPGRTTPAVQPPEHMPRAITIYKPRAGNPESGVLLKQSDAQKIEPGTQQFVRVAAAADAILREAGARVIGSPGYGREARNLASEFYSYVGLRYPAPGVRIGDRGPYTDVIVLTYKVAATGLDGYKRPWVYLGNNGVYTAAAEPPAVRLMDPLRQAVGIQDPYNGGNADWPQFREGDEGEVERVVLEFVDQAVTPPGEGKPPAWDTSAAEARSLLTPAYNQEVESLAQLRLASTRGDGVVSRSVGKRLDLRVEGDTARYIWAYAHRDAIWTQRFDLQRVGEGQWRIKRIHPATEAPAPGVGLEQNAVLLELERERVNWTVSELSVAAMVYGYNGGKDVAEQEGMARQVLSPDGPPVRRRLEEISRLIFNNEPPRESAADPTLETQLDGASATVTATYTVNEDGGGGRREWRVRFRLVHTPEGWKVTSYEPA